MPCHVMMTRGPLNIRYKIGRAYSTHGEMRNAYKIWLQIMEVKRPLRRPRHVWEDNIEVDIMEIGLEYMDHLA